MLPDERLLDMSVRASVLKLFDELRSDGLGVLLITHDLASAAVHADRIAVMFLGRIVEEGPARQVFREPGHPCTRALVSAMPQPDLTARPQRRVYTALIVNARKAFRWSSRGRPSR